MSSSAGHLGVIPACLSFLAIYSPSLGHSDETFRDQIVYYHSREGGTEKHRSKNDEEEEKRYREEINEKLRQIGLAQGMVQFAGYLNSARFVYEEKCLIS